MTICATFRRHCSAAASYDCSVVLAGALDLAEARWAARSANSFCGMMEDAEEGAVQYLRETRRGERERGRAEQCCRGITHPNIPLPGAFVLNLAQNSSIFCWGVVGSFLARRLVLGWRAGEDSPEELEVDILNELRVAEVHVKRVSLGSYFLRVLGVCALF